ncbi:MAG: pyridoxal phosphate-dependent aminotransferase [Candidatus Alcyoniella australis]|nr:pyridoxal phosphate-dependent aminotransferase [Candidatus Alcyoniella australis]
MELKDSPTMAITAKAKAMRASGEDVLGFGAGEPDFDTPDFIKAAAIEALNQGQTKYTPASGTQQLKRAVVDRLEQDYGLRYGTQNVVVSPGAKFSCYCAIQAVIDPGDEVLIPAPYWVSYPAMVELARGVPKVVQTSEEDGFLLTPDALREAITDRTRMLILNSPNNPTGAAYSVEQFGALMELALKHDLWVLSDEIYEKLVYDGFSHRGPATLSAEAMQNTILVSGVSKTYSMTGWRIGYTAAPPELAKAMGKLQSQSTSNPTSFAQTAAAAALGGSQDCVEQMRQAFARRREYVLDRLSRIAGIECFRPQGAFYVFPSVKALLGATIDGVQIADSVSFCDWLLTSKGVAVVPGVAFGTEGYFRLSYATDDETLSQGLDRIEQAAAELSAAK